MYRIFIETTKFRRNSLPGVFSGIPIRVFLCVDVKTFLYLCDEF
jgi:hypothetical protein